MTPSPLSTREKLVQSANRLVLEQGVEQLTLDAVARNAGVSKGGLLYHFPSKEALISGMMDHLLERYTEYLHQGSKEDPEPGSWLRAFIRASDLDERQREKSAGLLAAVTTNPELLTPLRTRYREWQQMIEDDGVDPALANLVRLAADGLFFCDLLGLAPLEGELREQVVEKMIDLTQTP
ncbi:TetR/AcrR family transcriptional regulator [Paludifilum halophilum]|uniref:HTH tetR-type domain-containing protein n=1 Tax=Paludifilum halophilum TaxID=1642702 RepID=A0A235B9S4_9BACL|nr:TetR/AcrR family transcriptional regulator [Paludifilum halophilum]OYD09016.1 hypothetical protein CHM34_04375 [Paludifilum halophilum]